MHRQLAPSGSPYPAVAKEGPSNHRVSGCWPRMHPRFTVLCSLILLTAAVLACKSKGPNRQTYDATALAVNGAHTCLIQLDGTPRCFGGDNSVNPPMVPAPKVALTRIESAIRFACGLRASDGGLTCWGACNLKAACAPPAGRFDDFALHDEAGGCAWRHAPKPEVACWGAGWSGITSPPGGINALDLKQVVFGPDWAVALKSDGTLISWGSSALLADPILTRAISSGKRVDSIGGRGALLCLIAAGHPECISYWSNQVPPHVSGKALQIDAASPRGAIPACVLSEGGGTRELRCSKSNKGKTLGTLRGDIDDIGIGNDHVCVLKRGNRVECVGDDLYGRVSGRSLGRSTDWP